MLEQPQPPSPFADSPLGERRRSRSASLNGFDHQHDSSIDLKLFEDVRPIGRMSSLERFVFDNPNDFPPLNSSPRGVYSNSLPLPLSSPSCNEGLDLVPVGSLSHLYPLVSPKILLECHTPSPTQKDGDDAAFEEYDFFRPAQDLRRHPSRELANLDTPIELGSDAQTQQPFAHIFSSEPQPFDQTEPFEPTEQEPFQTEPQPLEQIEQKPHSTESSSYAGDAMDEDANASLQQPEASEQTEVHQDTAASTTTDGPVKKYFLQASGTCQAIDDKKSVFCSEDRELWSKTFNAEFRGEVAVNAHRQDRFQGDVFYVKNGGEFLAAAEGHHSIVLSTAADLSGEEFPLQQVFIERQRRDLFDNLANKGYVYSTEENMAVVSLFGRRLLKVFREGWGHRFHAEVDGKSVCFYRLHLHFRCSRTGCCCDTTTSSRTPDTLSVLIFPNRRTASLGGGRRAAAHTRKTKVSSSVASSPKKKKTSKSRQLQTSLPHPNGSTRRRRD